MPRPKRIIPLSLKWMEFKDRRKNKWEVWVQSAPLILEGDECYAICFPHAHKIILDGGLEARMLRQVLIHELIHAACSEEYALRPRGRHIMDFTHDVEEDAALSVEATLGHVLPQMGLKLPPLPKGMPYLRKMRKAWKPL